MMASVLLMGTVVRFLLRLSPEMHEELKAWAASEERSLHAQIVYILKRALKEWR